MWDFLVIASAVFFGVVLALLIGGLISGNRDRRARERRHRDRDEIERRTTPRPIVAGGYQPKGTGPRPPLPTTGSGVKPNRRVDTPGPRYERQTVKDCPHRDIPEGWTDWDHAIDALPTPSETLKGGNVRSKPADVPLEPERPSTGRLEGRGEFTTGGYIGLDRGVSTGYPAVEQNGFSTGGSFGGSSDSGSSSSSSSGGSSD